MSIKDFLRGKSSVVCQIYLGLPRMGVYEYEYNYSDWYSQVKNKYHLTQNKTNLYFYGYKTYTSFHINAFMFQYIQFMVLGF